MPPADWIRQQNEQNPGRVAHTRQEAGSSDFPAIVASLRILQLNMEALSAARRSIIQDIAERHNVESTPRADDDAVIWLESTASAAIAK